MQAASLAQTLQWLQTLPALPASVRQALADTLLTGRASLQGQWQGGWRDPAVKLTLAAPELEWRNFGDKVSYTVTVSNDGSADSNNLVVVDTLDPGFRWSSRSP